MIPKGAKIFPLKAEGKLPKYAGWQENAVAVDQPGHPKGNYGILLDNMFLVVDIDVDHPERAAFEASLPSTWTQRTGRTSCVGVHYLYKVPADFKGKNTVYKASDGTRIADIKCNGFIVGPGSVINGNPYYMINEMEPLQLCRT